MPQEGRHQGLPTLDVDLGPATLRAAGLRQAAQGSRCQGRKSRRHDSVASVMATLPTTVDAAGLSWGPRALLRRLAAATGSLAWSRWSFALSRGFAHRGARLSALGQLSSGKAPLWTELSLDHHLGSRSQSVWGTDLRLRHAGYFRAGLVDCRPFGLGAAIFLAELAPRRLSDNLTFLIDLLAAVPSVIYGLLGVFILVPIMRTEIQPRSQARAGIHPAVSGPSLWDRFVDGWARAGHYDRSLHYFCFPRGLARGARRSARSGSGAGRHALGGHLESRRSLCAHGHHGFGFSGAGPRPG